MSQISLTYFLTSFVVLTWILCFLYCFMCWGPFGPQYFQRNLLAFRFSKSMQCSQEEQCCPYSINLTSWWKYFRPILTSLESYIPSLLTWEVRIMFIMSLAPIQCSLQNKPKAIQLVFQVVNLVLHQCDTCHCTLRTIEIKYTLCCGPVLPFT